MFTVLLFFGKWVFFLFETMFEYLITVVFETYGMFQFPFQIKTDQGWISKEMEKNGLKMHSLSEPFKVYCNKTYF